ncbi:MAG: GNAT family N-acetyltransferase [Chloroflexota bacterium]
MTLEIRAAHLDDATAVAAILRETNWFAHMAAESAAETAVRVRRFLQDCLRDDSHAIYVAVSAGEVVGYTAVHWLPYLFMTGPEGYVSELFVRPQARGLGVGRQLLDAVYAEAATRGCSRLSLLNGRQRESYQRQFYEKQGWEERPFMANFVRKLP